ncbi:uncharacterized protein LOC117321614 isoform X3 [Pecten maximus]|uniref:uncharacterized protein LOC117321614 isoform X3 n=1 Tax=Pecten maximus TaxID=6579 RepID=UPI001458A1E3|nr:uncharacterized protein LOC117321614 isoform X3 [Pecten maximus]
MDIRADLEYVSAIEEEAIDTPARTFHFKEEETIIGTGNVVLVDRLIDIGFIVEAVLIDDQEVEVGHILEEVAVYHHDDVVVVEVAVYHHCDVVVEEVGQIIEEVALYHHRDVVVEEVGQIIEEVAVYRHYGGVEVEAGRVFEGTGVGVGQVARLIEEVAAHQVVAVPHLSDVVV